MEHEDINTRENSYTQNVHKAEGYMDIPLSIYTMYMCIVILPTYIQYTICIDVIFSGDDF